MIEVIFNIKSRVSNLIGESVRYSFGWILLEVSIINISRRQGEQLVFKGPPTFLCRVFSNNSRFLTVASATGTDTGAPEACPVA